MLKDLPIEIYVENVEEYKRKLNNPITCQDSLKSLLGYQYYRDHNLGNLDKEDNKKLVNIVSSSLKCPFSVYNKKPVIVMLN